MAAIRELSLSDRLVALLCCFPEGRYSEDLSQISNFFYNHREDLGDRVRFDWNSTSPDSSEIREAYDAMHLADILHYETPSFKFRLNEEVKEAGMDLVSTLSAEEQKKLRGYALELSVVLSR